VAGGQVGDICPSHTQPGPSQHFGDPATFQRSASQFFQLGLITLMIFTQDSLLNFEDLLKVLNLDIKTLRHK